MKIIEMKKVILNWFIKLKNMEFLCERRFELNSDFIVIGFVSNGCF